MTVSIDARSLDGIEKDMTVINGDGLVGRIPKVNPTASTVLLVDTSLRWWTDGDTRRSASSRGQGGKTDGISSDPLAERHWRCARTFGSRGGVHTLPGIPIGGEDTGSAGWPVATIRPFVDVSQLSVVGVIVRPPRDDPRDSVLPPRGGTATDESNDESEVAIDANAETDDEATVDDGEDASDADSSDSNDADADSANGNEN